MLVLRNSCIDMYLFCHIYRDRQKGFRIPDIIRLFTVIFWKRPGLPLAAEYFCIRASHLKHGGRLPTAHLVLLAVQPGLAAAAAVQREAERILAQVGAVRRPHCADVQLSYWCGRLLPHNSIIFYLNISYDGRLGWDGEDGDSAQVVG